MSLRAASSRRSESPGCVPLAYRRASAVVGVSPVVVDAMRETTRRSRRWSSRTPARICRSTTARSPEFVLTSRAIPDRPCRRAGSLAQRPVDDHQQHAGRRHGGLTGISCFAARQGRGAFPRRNRFADERGTDGLGRECRRYLASFDLFVYPSLHEALGSTLLDAMQVGLPIVASNVGGIPDIVVDGVNGILVEPEDPEALIQCTGYDCRR